MFNSSYRKLKQGANIKKIHVGTFQVLVIHFVIIFKENKFNNYKNVTEEVMKVVIVTPQSKHDLRTDMKSSLLRLM